MTIEVLCKECDQLSATHLQRDDGQWECTECGNVKTCPDPQWSENCGGELTTPHQVKKGLCAGCIAVIRSWSDDAEDSEPTEQTKLITDGGSDTKDYLPNCNKPGCPRERYTSNGYFCKRHRVERPPCEAAAGMSDTANHEYLERRVCPNCRLFFDTGVDSDAMFCGQACERRHQNGVYL